MTWEGGEPTIGPLWSPRLEEALGPPRKPGADLTDRDRDVAASLQAIYEEAFFHRLGWLQKKTGLGTLCLAGGCAMNSVANGKIFARTGFRDVFIQSAAGDAGTALGAALSVWHETLGKPRGYVMEHSYFDDTRGQIVASLRANRRLRQVAQTLTVRGPGGAARGRGGGWCVRRRKPSPVAPWWDGSGDGWSGARGARQPSIPRRPRRADMKDILNTRIKRRRPSGPSHRRSWRRGSETLSSPIPIRS
jgi:carbamoyltransferase